MPILPHEIEAKLRACFEPGQIERVAYRFGYRDASPLSRRLNPKEPNKAELTEWIEALIHYHEEDPALFARCLAVHNYFVGLIAGGGGDVTEGEFLEYVKEGVRMFETLKANKPAAEVHRILSRAFDAVGKEGREDERASQPLRKVS